jgi:hypothetical protein
VFTVIEMDNGKNRGLSWSIKSIMIIFCGHFNYFRNGEGAAFSLSWFSPFMDVSRRLKGRNSVKVPIVA